MRERRKFDKGVVSFSELDTLATCEQRWRYRFPLGYEQEPSSAMTRGTGLHEITGTWWETGEVRTAAEVSNTEQLNYTDEEAELVDWIIARYIRHYANWRPRVKVLGTELEFSAPNALAEGITVVGHIDQVWEMDDLIIIREAKSMADWRRLDLVDVTTQESLYGWGARQLGIEWDSILFDAIRTYRWKPEKPTQKQILEDLGTNPFATKKAATEWARKEVERHPGVDRPDADSFEYRWLHRTTDQINSALLWSASVIDRRDALLKTEMPIRNIGTSCQGCSFQEDCWSAMSFPTLSSQIALDVD